MKEKRATIKLKKDDATDWVLTRLPRMPFKIRVHVKLANVASRVGLPYTAADISRVRNCIEKPPEIA